MRDDIHNRAPISPALRSLLKQALRPADQQRPDRLRDFALKPLAKEMRDQLSQTFVDALAKEDANPTLFGKSSLSGPHFSRVQADVLDHLKANPTASIRDALESAAGRHIESICRESEASMMAGGASRAELRPGLTAMRDALMGQVSNAVGVCLDDAKIAKVDHRVSLSESLPLGAKAPRARP